MFRHSQMYEVFVQERLELATKQYETDDAFEARLVRCVEPCLGGTGLVRCS
jgi:hypothetical protein